MITIASINLNKRFFNLKARSKLEEWLKKNNVSFLLVQEPWLRQNNRPDLFSNYCPQCLLRCLQTTNSREST